MLHLETTLKSITLQIPCTQGGLALYPTKTAKDSALTIANLVRNATVQLGDVADMYGPQTEIQWMKYAAPIFSAMHLGIHAFRDDGAEDSEPGCIIADHFKQVGQILGCPAFESWAYFGCPND